MKKIRQYLRQNRHAYFVLYVPVFIAMFIALERLVPSDCDYWASYMPLDDAIPFVPAFVLPYCMWYPYLIGTGLYLMARDKPRFLDYMRFIVWGFTAAMAFCLLVPNGQDLRPAAFERDSFFTRLISLIYAADTNTNVFPSMHVLGCAAAVSAAFKSPAMPRLRWASLVLALFICASTVLIKQHSFLDILGALAFAAPLYIAVYFVTPGLREKREKRK
ncbi:MAG: hypothetical protein NC319_08710 [Butyricicoccus sp.]|nr:hypothetical protein [Butyricicoccus sp.]